MPPPPPPPPQPPTHEQPPRQEVPPPRSHTTQATAGMASSLARAAATVVPFVGNPPQRNTGAMMVGDNQRAKRKARELGDKNALVTLNPELHPHIQQHGEPSEVDESVEERRQSIVGQNSQIIV